MTLVSYETFCHKITETLGIGFKKSAEEIDEIIENFGKDMYEDFLNELEYSFIAVAHPVVKIRGEMLDWE